MRDDGDSLLCRMPWGAARARAPRVAMVYSVDIIF